MPGFAIPSIFCTYPYKSRVNTVTINSKFNIFYVYSLVIWHSRIFILMLYPKLHEMQRDDSKTDITMRRTNEGTVSLPKRLDEFLILW